MLPSDKPPPKSAGETKGMLPSLEQLERRRRFHYGEMVARGGWRIRVLFYFVLVILFIIVAAPSAEAYGYSQLQTSFQAQRCSPLISTGIQSVPSAVNDRFNGNLIAAAPDIITGLHVQGVVTVSNSSFVPLYVPTVSHRVAIGGEESKNDVWTEAMWIAPANRKTQAISLYVGINELPENMLPALANGGTIRVEIVSEVLLGPFSTTKIANVVTSISQPLSSYME
jgi:hypothetical protein